MGTGRLKGSTFGGARGRRIAWRSWRPSAEPPRGVVVIVHGFGEHSGRYQWAAEQLGSAGYVVAALDHHGHGRSEGVRARISFADAVFDLDQLVQAARERDPGRPLFVLGHSMGGAIALRYVLAHPAQASGLILSGPLVQVEGRRASKLLGRLLGRVAPGAPVARLDPEHVSRDPQVVAAYREDPLVHHGPLPAATAAEFLAHAETLPAAAGAVRMPILLLYGSDDRLCDPAGSVMLSERLGSSDLTVHPYEGLYHEILNEPERAQVMEDIVAWLGAHTAPASG